MPAIHSSDSGVKLISLWLWLLFPPSLKQYDMALSSLHVPVPRGLCFIYSLLFIVLFGWLLGFGFFEMGFLSVAVLELTL